MQIKNLFAILALCLPLGRVMNCRTYWGEIMDTRRIKKLIELVKETGVGELEVKSGEDSVRISYHPSGTAPLVQHQVVAPAPAVAPAPVCSSDVTKDPAASPLQPPVVDDGIVLKYVKSA